MTNNTLNLAFVIPRIGLWIVGSCGALAILFAADRRDVPEQLDQVSPVALEKLVPAQAETTSQLTPVAANTPAFLSDMKIQPGPCKGFPGTIQVIANVCDDGSGSFFVRLNPNDAPNIRVAHLMERVRSYKLDFLNRRILSVTPVTDTLCFNHACVPIMYGAYGRYEFLK